MRPEPLFPLFTAIETLPGVGKKLTPAFQKLAGTHVLDLLWHLPSGIIDRRYAPELISALPGSIVTVDVSVEAHIPRPSGRYDRKSPHKVVVNDGSAPLTLVFFNAKSDWLQKILPLGGKVIVSGRLEVFNNQLQITHPDHIVPPEERASVQIVEPTYPLSAGISQKVLRKALLAALEKAPPLDEWQDPEQLARKQWPSWLESLKAVHMPEDAEVLSALSPVRQRLAYDELLANQLALLLVRNALRKQAGQSIKGDCRQSKLIMESLPFALTGAQQRALAEIKEDMARPERMLRLLQGDVGSGKTVVALLCLTNAIETGAQGALMAPTEILARQHLESLSPLAEAAGIKLAILTGRDKGKSRSAILESLEAGDIDILIGTHAIFQTDVIYKNLAAVVIDEQHRFGVHQRLELSSKGEKPDVLVMTATPIPRTLALTAYGDMDVSRLDEKPPGRKPVDTRVMPTSKLGDLVAGIKRTVAEGNKVYWVCPLVDESEVSDLAAAEQRHTWLKAQLGERVGLVHGRMKGPEKDAVMTGFAGQDLDVLVATTVIEVGVNVPEATVMVIEHAERFGLAQLHQLRGRVGRGERKASCLLLYAGNLTETARERLATMRRTEDGFEIAEEDLRLRGGGEVLGTRQSGLPEFRLADIAVHGDLLALARNEAKYLVDKDPKLTGSRGLALKTLLYLFERDGAVRTLRSG